MHTMTLEGCGTRPLGSYLKALAVLRLVSEQLDPGALGWWEGDCFRLRCRATDEELLAFFLNDYRPTPILAPWNGGSGFYEKDRKVGVDAIANSTSSRFAEYRTAITFFRGLPEISAGKAEKAEEEERRTAILLKARNWLPDSAVEWLDAAMGLAANGKRSFPPMLGTGGNEGRLDYTNNFMERITNLLIAPDTKSPTRELLRNALFNSTTEGLQPASVGQFDPGRTGGFNQGQGVTAPDVPVNPWGFVLTLEGAVAWASGIYRRQGISYRQFLCSPFTVGASAIGYGSAGQNDDARAEIWTPIWRRPVRFPELKVLLREGRANVGERPAENGLQFAEAACSLGVDRGIDAFVRYNLLKRRGDSYIALPTGLFPTGYRSESDRIRELEGLLERLNQAELPSSGETHRRRVETAMYETLLHGGADRLRGVLAALGSYIRAALTTGKAVYAAADLDPQAWITACGGGREVRIAAAVASIYDSAVGSIRDNLTVSSGKFAWQGGSLAERLVSVLEKRLRLADASESTRNPVGGSCELHAGDATIFIEESVDDRLIEELMFAFTFANWKGYKGAPITERAEIVPAYAVLKHLFLATEVDVGGEKKRLRADTRILSLLGAGRVPEALDLALFRLRAMGLNPIRATYFGGVDPIRLAASLLIPVKAGAPLFAAILHDREKSKV